MTKAPTQRLPGFMQHPGVRAGGILAVCVALAVWMQATGAPDPIARSVPLVVMAIGFRALGVLPEAFAGLLFMLGAVTLAGHAPAVVFPGFATSAFWLIFAGAILSASVPQSGLSRWLVGRFVARRFSSVGVVCLPCWSRPFCSGHSTSVTASRQPNTPRSTHPGNWRRPMPRSDRARQEPSKRTHSIW